MVAGRAILIEVRCEDGFSESNADRSSALVGRSEVAFYFVEKITGQSTHEIRDDQGIPRTVLDELSHAAACSQKLIGVVVLVATGLWMNADQGVGLLQQVIHLSHTDGIEFAASSISVDWGKHGPGSNE